jgi:signal peptidase
MTTKKLLSLTSKVALGLLLAVIVGALAVLTVVPRAVHGSALTVLTGSMTPSIPVGSVVLVRPVDPGTLHVGDVITYQKQPGKPEYITHRITAIHTGTTPVTLTTKGDANRGADPWSVPVTSVRGRVLFHVPYLGTVRNAVSGGAIALPLAILGLLGYAVAQLLAARRDKKTAGRRSRPGPLVAPAPALEEHQRGATHPHHQFDGLTPVTVAGLLSMNLLDEGAETFTLATAREPHDAEQLERALARFSPVTMVRADVVSVPDCPPALADRPTDLEAASHAAA